MLRAVRNRPISAERMGVWVRYWAGCGRSPTTRDWASQVNCRLSMDRVRGRLLGVSAHSCQVLHRISMQAPEGPTGDYDASAFLAGRNRRDSAAPISAAAEQIIRTTEKFVILRIQPDPTAPAAIPSSHAV
jgi:hypothetical protein